MLSGSSCSAFNFFSENQPATADTKEIKKQLTAEY